MLGLPFTLWETRKEERKEEKWEESQGKLVISSIDGQNVSKTLSCLMRDKGKSCIELSVKPVLGYPPCYVREKLGKFYLRWFWLAWL